MDKLDTCLKPISGILDCRKNWGKKGHQLKTDINSDRYVLVSKLLPICFRIRSLTLDRCNYI